MAEDGTVWEGSSARRWAGAFLAIGGFSAIGIFCLAAVGISALVTRLAMREPDEGMA